MRESGVRPAPTWLLPAIVLALLASAPVAAREGRSKTEGESQDSPWPVLEKGTMEWALAANSAVAHDIWGGVADRHFVSAGGRLGRVVTGAIGPGFLRGRLAVNVEVYPLFVMFRPTGATQALSVSLIDRHYLDVRSRLRPFLSFGAGILWSRDDIPPDTTSFNFTPQAGVGIAFADRAHRVYAFEYRLHHTSNASLASENPGINSSFFQFSVSFFRRRKPTTSDTP